MSLTGSITVRTYVVHAEKAVSLGILLRKVIFAGYNLQHLVVGI